MVGPDAAPEWSHLVLMAQLGGSPLNLHLVADEATRAALAKRFDLPAIAALEADVALTRAGDIVKLTGTLTASATQSCVISRQDVAATVNEPVTLKFMSQPAAIPTAEEEIELAADDCDVIWHDGRAIDVAEAMAQSFALALEPFPRAPDAEEFARAAGIKAEEEAGAFGALAALKAQMEGKK